MSAQFVSHGPNITGSTSYVPERAVIIPPTDDASWQGLRLADAKHLASLISSQRLLMAVDPDLSRSIYVVRTVRILERPAREGLDLRLFDLFVNGAIFDPRAYAILYNERIMNLGALFTYRQEFYPSGQAPVWEYDE